MSWDKERIAQLQLPDPADDDPHSRLLWLARDPTGPGCWYISTPGFEGVCPVGLFVKV